MTSLRSMTLPLRGSMISLRFDDQKPRLGIADSLSSLKLPGSKVIQSRSDEVMPHSGIIGRP